MGYEFWKELKGYPVGLGLGGRPKIPGSSVATRPLAGAGYNVPLYATTLSSNFAFLNSRLPPGIRHPVIRTN